jgi:hypothetical protein
MAEAQAAGRQTTKAEDILARWGVLQPARASWDSHWQEVRDLVYPTGQSLLGLETPGGKSYGKVLDSTGEQANELLAASLQGMLCNPGTEWVKLRCRDSRLNRAEEIAVWLENAEDVMYAVFNSPLAGFATAQHEKYLDLCTYGTGGMFIDDRPAIGPVFQARPLAELYLAENADGRVDTVFRAFRWSARQAAQRFGAALPPAILEKARDPRRQDQEDEYLHAVYPDEAYANDNRAPLAPPRRVKSCYLALGAKTLVEDKFYRENPLVIARWAKRANETYGRGPGMKALADVKMLQRSMRNTIRSVEKKTDPPVMVADDGVVGQVRMNSSGITTVRWDMMMGAASPIRPFDSGGRPDLAEEFNDRVRGRIERAFYNHLLQMERDPRMTATQTIKIAEETLRILGPVGGRIEIEDLGPQVRFVFNLLYHAGAFGPAPAALGGAALDIEFVSPLAKARRLAEATGIGRTLEIMAPLLDRNPDLIDNIDQDLVFRLVAEIFGWPKTTLRPWDRVVALRQARAQQTAALHATETAIKAGGPAARLIGAVSKAAAAPAPAPAAA